MRALPQASRPFLADLWPLWIAHLDDNIPSVREDAAIALGDAAAALQQEALAIILPHLRYASVMMPACLLSCKNLLARTPTKALGFGRRLAVRSAAFWNHRRKG